MKGSRTDASRLYFGAMVALGAAVIGLAGYRLLSGGTGYQWLILASLTVVTGSFALKIPGINSRISIGDTLICTNLVLFGPAAGTLTAVLDGVFGSLRCKTKSRRLEFALFNASSMAISASLGGLVFTQVVGKSLFSRDPVTPVSTFLPALALMALVYYLANSVFVAAIVALEQHENVFSVWRDKFIWPIVNYIAAAAVAGLLAQNEGSITALLVLTILMVLAAIYVSSKSYVDTAEEACENLAQSRRWLSSVEMLAEAIGAKEDWSRENTARLRAYVRRLGQAMGCSDEAVEGLETAALLHDIGKVAVPETILTKPGKLTDEEFDKIKVHPTVAADMLTSASFPALVTDCVRYLREHWDGSGYPHQLRQVEIPVEARILAVADCYTVLTSDRPYRRRYDAAGAREILRSSAGTTLDPEAVARFLGVLAEMEPETETVHAR